jgi:hypothetical protein
MKIFLAANDPDFPEEYEVWERYKNQVSNLNHAIETGYFYAVTEAKVIEGSAVPLGSNPITPTMEVEPKQETEIELLKYISQEVNKSKEPDVSTHEINAVEFLKELNINLK